MVEKNSPFPVIPGTHWWALRKKFRQSVPTNLSLSSLMIALDIKKEKTARANVYDQLVKIGLIDKDGKVNQELAGKWREDEHYAEVCNQIRQRIYPKELLELAPEPNGSRTQIARWFRINAGVGESLANKMASVYELLTEADASKGEETINSKKAKREGVDKHTFRGQKAPTKPDDHILRNEIGRADDRLSTKGPSIHIDIQIHISPDASAEQIEQVFANMAKHIYSRHK